MADTEDIWECIQRLPRHAQEGISIYLSDPYGSSLSLAADLRAIVLQIQSLTPWGRERITKHLQSEFPRQMDFSTHAHSPHKVIHVDFARTAGKTKRKMPEPPLEKI